MTRRDDSTRSPATATWTDYGSLLEACRRMDEHCVRPLDDANIADNDLLGTMATVCTAASTRSQDTSKQAAATSALITAALLKVLEVSDIKIARLTERSPAASRARMEDLFALKQIDLVLLQAKVFFSQGDQYGGAQRAVELHQAIRSLIQRDFSNWSWYD